MDLEQRRLDLHEILVNILGSRQVYFQPPANVALKYPCIIYGRERADSKFANNSLYLFKQGYQVTLIGLDPDSSDVFTQILRLPLTTFDRSFAADNLNHDVFNLFF